MKTDGNKQAAFCGGFQLIEVQLAELSVDLFLMAANVHYTVHGKFNAGFARHQLFLFIVKRIKFVFSSFSYIHILNFVPLGTTQLKPAPPTVEVFISKKEYNYQAGIANNR